LVARGAARSVREYHTDVNAEFLVQLTPAGIAEMRTLAGLSETEPIGFLPRAEVESMLVSYFKLSSPVSARNMHLFDALGRIRRYASAEEILSDFIPARLGVYAARKLRMVSLLTAEVTRVEARQRFLNEAVSGTLALAGRSRAVLAQELWDRGYPVFDTVSTSARTAALTSDKKTDPPAAVVAASHLLDQTSWEPQLVAVSAAFKTTDAPSSNCVRVSSSPTPLVRAFDYLLGLPLWQLTSDSVERSAAAAAGLRRQLEVAVTSQPVDMWLAELETLEWALSKDVALTSAGRGVHTNAMR
jgi:DNA topoisomerase II